MRTRCASFSAVENGENAPVEWVISSHLLPLCLPVDQVKMFSSQLPTAQRRNFPSSNQVARDDVHSNFFSREKKHQISLIKSILVQWLASPYQRTLIASRVLPVGLDVTWPFQNSISRPASVRCTWTARRPTVHVSSPYPSQIGLYAIKFKWIKCK